VKDKNVLVEIQAWEMDAGKDLGELLVKE